MQKLVYSGKDLISTARLLKHMNLADENVVVALILRYGFDLGEQSALSMVRSWSCKYDPSFLSLAVVESLHLGRYKAVSIEQVLNGWQRRGEPIPHFSEEFADMVSGPGVLAKLTIADEQETNDELELELEKTLFSASDIAEAHRSTEVFELSDPALDEGLSEATPPPSRLTTALRQASLSLTPSNYSIATTHSPQDQWHQPATADDDEPTLAPPAQVSPFYYKLRAVAAAAPTRQRNRR
jgi:hypothetical protein